MSDVIRGGGNKHVTFCSRDLWKMAMDQMAQASDRMEEDSTRRTCSIVGVNLARFAYLMEKAAALASLATPHEQSS